MHYEQFVEISNGFQFEILEEFIRVLKKINIYIWCNKNQIYELLDFFHKKHNCYWNIITWHKRNVCPTCNNKYMSDTEYCLFFREKGVKLFGNCKSKKTYYETLTNKADKKEWGHPTIKPLHIIKNFVINSSSVNDMIFDPFAGSGTTCVACKELNRRFIGCEISQKWHETANYRLNNI